MKVLYSLLFYFTILTTLVVSAQKLPGKQQKGVLAPTDVKIDGKAEELKGKFLAFNTATDLFYTIANDGKKLYLTLQAKDGDIINRIAGGGVTFKITDKSRKNDPGVSVTYPIKQSSSILMFSLWPPKGVIWDTVGRVADSIMKANNKRFVSNFKFLKVKGIKDLDTLSIYNENGIEAAGLFDMKRSYTMELSIPLELLSNEINKAGTFAYQIRINGGAPNSFKMRLVSADPAMKAQIEEAMAAATFKIESANTAPTDFTGQYTLVK